MRMSKQGERFMKQKHLLYGKLNYQPQSVSGYSQHSLPKAARHHVFCAAQSGSAHLGFLDLKTSSDFFNLGACMRGVTGYELEDTGSIPSRRRELPFVKYKPAL